jgi:cysteinyl-tRNA synthetase
LKNFRRLVKDARTAEGSNPEVAAIVKKALADFETAMDDDLNTSAALAAVHNMVREINTVLAGEELRADDRVAVQDAVAKFDSVLGIFGEEETTMLDAEIEALIEQRQEARQQRDFARSDEIRDLLAERGILLEDTKDGMRWRRK